MSTFTQAAISYHGIPPDVVVRSDVHTGEDGVLYLTVQIPLKDEDMGPIVKRMEQIEQYHQHEHFVPDSLDLAQLRDDYAALTPAERGKYKSFNRYKSVRQLQQAEQDINEANATSEGIGGRKVQHVDAAAEQDAVSELPAAVWVDGDELTNQQRVMQSDSHLNEDGSLEVLIQVALLTPEQKAKYCGEQKP